MHGNRQRQAVRRSARGAGFIAGPYANVQLLRGNFLDVQLALQQSASLPLQLQVFGADGGIAKLRFQLRNAPALRQ